MECSSGGDLDKKMSTVVATSAALVATVCAGVAEALGAYRAHVASVINTGLTTRSSADILSLIPTTATYTYTIYFNTCMVVASLRGAAALELRAATNINASEDEKILAKGAKFPMHTPSRRVQLRMVCIHLKHGKLTLMLGRKYLRALTTCKELSLIFEALHANALPVLHMCKQ